MREQREIPRVVRILVPRSGVTRVIQRCGLVEVYKRACDMAEARYLRRMKRMHEGRSPFDPKKVTAFDAKRANLPDFPNTAPDGSVIR